MKTSMQSPSTPAAKSAFTLVELLVALTVLSVLSILGFQVLTLMLRLDDDAQQQGNSARIRERLAEDFRNDVHSAVDATFHSPENGPPALELKHRTGVKIQYTVSERGVQRLIPGPDPEHPQSLEVFDLPDLQVRFAREQELLTLELRPASPLLPDTRKTATAYPMVIEVVLQRGETP